MTRYAGGTKASGGYYWNARGWNVEVVPAEGGTLPGDGAARYVKVPFPLLFVVVPVMGALFLVALPVIGFAVFGYAIAKRIAAPVRRGAAELASTVQPGLVHGEAHLTGKPGEAKPAEGAKAPEAIAKLEQEIQERRDG
jgi:hypothetical protein